MKAVYQEIWEEEWYRWHHISLTLYILENLTWNCYTHSSIIFIYQSNIGGVITGRGNIARGKNTRQSSTGYGGSSSRAVDGNRNNRYGGKSCTHTHRQRNAWWRVDLGADYKVGMVKITNRGDCCGNRLSNFDIRVGNRDGNPKANALYVYNEALLFDGLMWLCVDEFSFSHFCSIMCSLEICWMCFGHRARYTCKIRCIVCNE